MTWIVLAVGTALWLGLKWGHWAADRESAFRRGYCHGWYDGLNGEDFRAKPKSEQFGRGVLPSVGPYQESEDA